MEEYGDIQSYVDEDGFRVHVGSVVQYAEGYDNPGNSDKYYYIRRMPNFADMIEMSECKIDENGKIIDKTDNLVITVAPYQIGAI